jgi:prophage regulatory protein
MLQKILRLPALLEVSGLKRSEIYAQMTEGKFPKSIPLGKRAMGWIEEDIIEWQRARIAARDASRKAA